MKSRIQYLVLLTFALASTAFAQGGLFDGCTTSGSAVYSKLVCQFPYSVGLYNNATALGTNSQTQPSAAVIATIFNSAIATQVSQLPVSTATAGTVLLYENGTYRTYHNQGPILTDRPQTVGKHHLFLGYSVSQYVFNAIDGQSLASLPFAYARNVLNSGGGTISTTYTTEQTKLAFRLTQHVAIATFGVTDRMDVSAIVPVERISIGASTPVNNNWVVAGTSFGPYSTSISPTHGTAYGIGDVTINAKYLLWNGAHKSSTDPGATSHAGRSAIAAGLNLREPFGDDLNLLGSGSFGVNPYLVASYMATVSPHAKIGYQWNSASELNPSIKTTTAINSSGQVTTSSSTGPNQALPGGYVYDVGADWAVGKQLTIAADLLGNQYLNSTVLANSTTSISFTNLSAQQSNVGGCTVSNQSASAPYSATLTCSSTTFNTSSYTVNKLSTGIKWNPVRQLVISANVTTQLNNKGLRSRPVPMLGMAYKF